MLANCRSSHPHRSALRSSAQLSSTRHGLQAAEEPRRGYDEFAWVRGAVPAVASSATSRGGTSTPTTPRGVPAWTLPPVSPRANHLAKIVPLSMEGKELRRRLCHHHHHHHRRADRFSSLPPPPSAHYHRYRQRHRHCTAAASSYTAINRHLAERGYQNLRTRIWLFGPYDEAAAHGLPIRRIGLSPRSYAASCTVVDRFDSVPSDDFARHNSARVDRYRRTD